MASATPARLLGVEPPALVAGGPADLVVLDHERRVTATIVGGQVRYRSK
jgi:N-acetylglucosamine-6-phosphate deacetylase